MTKEEREKAIRKLMEIKDNYERSLNLNTDFSENDSEDELYALELAIRVLKQEPCEDMGEVSDGYHTFNQLYHQRAVLFATIVNQNQDKAWKSFKHSDGKYCFDSNGEWFIVGIDTPQGSYTYHYEKKYWDIFDCKELQCGKEWDGHTEEDVTRLLSLKQQPCEDAISRKAVITIIQNHWWNCRDIDKLVKELPSVAPTQKMKAEIIDDLIKEIKDAEKKFDDKGAHNISAGFYYARKVLEKMRGAELPYTDKSGLEYADQPTLRSAT